MSSEHIKMFLGIWQLNLNGTSCCQYVTMKKKSSKSESLYDCKQVTDHHAPLYPPLELPRPQSLAGELGVPGDEGLGFVGQLFLDGIQFIIEHQVHVHILLVNGSPDGLNKAN